MLDFCFSVVDWLWLWLESRVLFFSRKICRILIFLLSGLFMFLLLFNVVW